MTVEELNKKLSVLKQNYPTLVGNYCCSVNDEGNIDFFRLVVTFTSDSDIENYFDGWEKSLQLQEFQLGEYDRRGRGRRRRRR